MPANPIIQPPTGTRDLYPVEAARRRYITEAWRRVSINHGFEEIDGPTFETTELYTKKSGEGIVSEIFGVFSGKDEAGVKALGERLAKGEDAPAPYALRPEFTPTLARMYAAKAASLPKPTKWFSVGPYFRAERPQRGRLREFLQLNCDVIGEPSPDAEADAIACCIGILTELGLSSREAKVQVNDRRAIASLLARRGVKEQAVPASLQLIDAWEKLSEDERVRRAQPLGLLDADIQAAVFSTARIHMRPGENAIVDEAIGASSFTQIGRALDHYGFGDWLQFNFGLARGLAYYTGTVFEVVVDNERAVAGGGRYDNLIELFGGPPTPAVGFGMGDVVLSLVLQDKGLMPSDAELMGLVGQCPDVFVISSGSPEAESQIPKLLAALRRGTSRTPSTTSSAPASTPASTQDPGPRTTDSFLSGFHARRSYKTTKNVGKLLQEAAKAGARFAVIIESATTAKLKDMATGAQDERSFTLEELPAELRRRLGRA